MEHEKEFRQFVDAWKAEGMQEPVFEYNESANWFEYQPRKNSETLDLETEISVFLDPLKEPILKELNVSDVCQDRIPVVLRPDICFVPLHVNRDTIFDYDRFYLPPGKWHRIPKHFKEQSALIKRLDDFILKEEPSNSVRNSRAFVDKTWREFYSELVRKGRLKWANIRGEKFPYVVTNLNVLGNVGRSECGLYFVSTDIATEPWQESMVAYHERFCQRYGHEEAVKREIQLVKELGKEKEYESFREKIREDTKKGKFV